MLGSPTSPGKGDLLSADPIGQDELPKRTLAWTKIEVKGFKPAAREVSLGLEYMLLLLFYTVGILLNVEWRIRHL
jgi:hypothetical protein